MKSAPAQTTIHSTVRMLRLFIVFSNLNLNRILVHLDCATRPYPVLKNDVGSLCLPRLSVGTEQSIHRWQVRMYFIPIQRYTSAVEACLVFHRRG